jgi:uncharacterized membrane protein
MWQAPKVHEDRGDSRLFVPALDPADLIDDAFGALARDGADKVEVQLRLQKALATLAGHDDPALAEAAREMSDRALSHARERLALPSDIRRVEACAGKG